MKLTTKLGTILNPNFVGAARKLSAQSMKVQAAYWLAKLMKAINEEGQTGERAKLEILKKYGVSKNEGREYTLEGASEEDARQAFSELDTLYSQEVELAGCKKVEIAQSATLSVQELILLEDFVTIEGIEDEPCLPEEQCNAEERAKPAA